jgi:hypothetical protein
MCQSYEVPCTCDQNTAETGSAIKFKSWPKRVFVLTMKV